MSPNLSSIFLIAGIAVLSATMVWNILIRRQRATKRAADRRAAVQAARETERKRQAAFAEPSKVKLATGAHAIPERIPLGEPHDITFTAAVSPRSVAKWETEIHQVGRQMIGQLDSKSVVLQTLTREANRAANRLEILIDHLETLLKNTVPSPKPSEPDDPPPAEPPNLISHQAATATAFADVLDELENELDRFDDSDEESNPQATVLKVVPMVPESVPETPPTVSIAGISTFSHGTHRISVQPKGMEFSVVSAPSPPPSPPIGRKPFTSLFDDSLVTPPTDTVTTLGLSSIPAYQTPLIEQSATLKPVSEPLRDRFVSELGTPSDKRRQVEMLTDYGYSPKQIAEDLNITVGEVELMINLRN